MFGKKKKTFNISPHETGEMLNVFFFRKTLKTFNIFNIFNISFPGLEPFFFEGPKTDLTYLTFPLF